MLLREDKMKKIFTIVLIVAIISLLMVFVPSVFAQTSKDPSAPSAGPGSTTSSGQEKVDYQLPYPGVLPDSPLYGLKVLRDRIYGFFVSDPLLKSEFDLLQADKRLNSGLFLFNKGKKELAESTISKGENYFDDEIKNLRLAKQQGMEINYLVSNTSRSLKKHAEVLSQLKKQTKGSLKKKFEVLEKRILDLEKQVDQLKT